MGLLRILIAGLLLVLIWRAFLTVRDWWRQPQLPDETESEQGVNPLLPCSKCGTYLPKEGLDPDGHCVRCRDGGTTDRDEPL
ncbi:MAG: hypothetical protein COX57_11280 [Alphaproteobacteria bacterium CG_4_10_14_0_2_um_filter_63_37]|nr:MAG: hypothetical protein AUJ55_08725 [Proteobacteria bacterium CG1_02_64_396]PJA23880.1 MAG: hypothetical protein COX57_11280 [Alphaproteobacteria bacterium CG_4_10_14_0_2_um_filter_63_37]